MQRVGFEDWELYMESVCTGYGAWNLGSRPHALEGIFGGRSRAVYTISGFGLKICCST